MERAVLGEAIQRELGDRQVMALMFCTHDLDPSFFEQEVLQAFIGNDLQHNRRTREIQLNYVIRQRQIYIDVYYEGRALAAHEGAARLDWNRIRMQGKHLGKFHPKVILALCTDGQTESLLVCTASANLTRGGWWTNVECADVVTIQDGVRHGYVEGLQELVKQLRTRGKNLARSRRLSGDRRVSEAATSLPAQVTPGSGPPGILARILQPRRRSLGPVRDTTR